MAWSRTRPTLHLSPPVRSTLSMAASSSISACWTWPRVRESISLRYLPRCVLASTTTAIQPAIPSPNITMSSISVTLRSPRKVSKWFNKQLRFAALGAVNDSAFVVRTTINDSLEHDLIIRRRWVLSGTRVSKATKARPVASVGTTRAFLEHHVTGGLRYRNAIPTRHTRRSVRRVVTRRRWPGALRDSRHFFARSDGELPRPFRQRHAGRGEPMVFRRGRGRRRKLQVRWVLPTRQRVNKNWHFFRPVASAVPAEFRRAFPRRLEQAFATARPV